MVKEDKRIAPEPLPDDKAKEKFLQPKTLKRDLFQREPDTNCIKRMIHDDRSRRKAIGKQIE